MVNNHIKLAIIDYGSGNLHSIFKAAKQAAASALSQRAPKPKKSKK